MTPPAINTASQPYPAISFGDTRPPRAAPTDKPVVATIVTDARAWSGALSAAIEMAAGTTMPRQTVVRKRITEMTAIPDEITVSSENPPNDSIASKITVLRGIVRTIAPLAR